MNPEGTIYPLSDVPIDELESPEVKEDVARLDGFLRGRAERDAIRRQKYLEKNGVQVWDSRTKGPYRKEPVVEPKLRNEQRIDRLETAVLNMAHSLGEGDSIERILKGEMNMGIEGIEELSGNQGDPGDEHVETPNVDEPPSTDAQPGEPGDGGHEVSTGSPDDPTQPDQTNEPEHATFTTGESGQPAEGLVHPPHAIGDTPPEPVDPTHPPHNPDVEHPPTTV